MPSTTKLPVIFVWDMDQCLIGESDLLTESSMLTQYIVNACKSEKIASCKGIITNRKVCNAETVTSEFFRPGMDVAFAAITQMFNGCAEHFIFSNGTAKYVQEMVELIEDHIKIKFNRPLLTREYTTESPTGNKEKSIKMHYNIFFKALVSKYPELKKETNIELVKNSRIIYMDDNNWTEELSRDKFIQVKPYTFTPVIDVLWNISFNIRCLPVVQDYLQSYKWNAFVEPKPSVSITQRNLQYYAFMTELNSKYLQNNITSQNDTFFPEFVNALKPLKKLARPFTSKNLDELRNKLREKHAIV
jgi:hypothetical protein